MQYIRPVTKCMHRFVHARLAYNLMVGEWMKVTTRWISAAGNEPPFSKESKDLAI